jgi:hypothetical protein
MKLIDQGKQGKQTRVQGKQTRVQGKQTRVTPRASRRGSRRA